LDHVVGTNYGGAGIYVDDVLMLLLYAMLDERGELKFSDQL